MSLTRHVLVLTALFHASAAASTARAASEGPHRATFFLNFDGEALKYGTNAALGQAACSLSPVDFPAAALDEAARLASVALVEERLAAYGVRVTAERPPPELPYSTVHIGGSASLIDLPNIVFSQACNTDCGDTWPRDAAMVFTEVVNDPTWIAKAALNSIGRISGLDFVTDARYIMFASPNIGDLEWSTACVPLHEKNGCGYVHAESCPDGGQNDHAELLARFGPNSPDTQAPQVTLLAPADGAELPAAPFNVSAEVSDDHAGFGWKLVVRRGGEVLAEAPAFASETAWALDLDPGTYEIEVAAIDHDRNVGKDVVTIHVGVPAPAPDEGTTDTSEGESSGGESSGGESSGGESSGGEGEGTGSAGTGAPNDAELGCACDTTSSSAPGALLSALLLAARPRRRRAARVRPPGEREKECGRSIRPVLS